MFAWASVCVGAPREVRHDEKSSADEESKWVLFCVDRRTFVHSCCFSAGTHRHTHASVIVCVSVCLPAAYCASVSGLLVPLFA